jgi:hypothetical protein
MPDAGFVDRAQSGKTGRIGGLRAKRQAERIMVRRNRQTKIHYINPASILFTYKATRRACRTYPYDSSILCPTPRSCKSINSPARLRSGFLPATLGAVHGFGDQASLAISL